MLLLNVSNFFEEDILKILPRVYFAVETSKITFKYEFLHLVSNGHSLHLWNCFNFPIFPKKVSPLKVACTR